MKIKIRQLEVGIVGHCINKCRGCNHFSPITPKYFMEPLTLRKDLDALKEVVEVTDHLAILGGEPLLHPHIGEILRIANQSSIAPNVVVVTNGQLLLRMNEDFWDTVKRLEVDLYPNKISDSELEQIKDTAKKYEVKINFTNIGTFYKSLSPQTPLNETQARFSRCPTTHKDKCYTIHEGYFYRCPQSSLIPKLFLGANPTVDWLPLEGITVEKLQAFINSTVPPLSCCRCSVQEQYIPWSETTREKWLEESTND